MCETYKNQILNNCIIKYKGVGMLGESYCMHIVSMKDRFCGYYVRTVYILTKWYYVTGIWCFDRKLRKVDATNAARHFCVSRVKCFGNRFTIITLHIIIRDELSKLSNSRILWTLRNSNSSKFVRNVYSKLITHQTQTFRTFWEKLSSISVLLFIITIIINII